MYVKLFYHDSYLSYNHLYLIIQYFSSPYSACVCHPNLSSLILFSILSNLKVNQSTEFLSLLFFSARLFICSLVSGSLLRSLLLSSNLLNVLITLSEYLLYNSNVWMSCSIMLLSFSLFLSLTLFLWLHLFLSLAMTTLPSVICSHFCIDALEFSWKIMHIIWGFYDVIIHQKQVLLLLPGSKGKGRSL